MKILFTGKDPFTYNRTQVLFTGLRKLSDIAVTVHPIKSKQSLDKASFRNLSKEFDYIYIPPFRHQDVRFIRKLTDKPIIFDPLISTYLTKVVDYGQYWKAPLKYFIDKRAFGNADILIADTQTHKDYFSKKYKIPEDKIHVVPVGVITSDFQPVDIPKADDKFHVGFYGSFIPLQGVDKIIEAANLLNNKDDIVFDLLGDGKDLKHFKKLAAKYRLENLNFHGWVQYKELSNYINRFDLCLGIFGDSLKADAVVPNKAFHYGACGKCILTKDTPGIKEVFTPDVDIILTGNKPEEIAEKILAIKSSPIEADLIAKNAYRLITENYNEVEIAKKFAKILK